MQDASDYFGRDDVTLFHGSQVQVKTPAFGMGNPHNDYGLGFYLTESLELASEWACPEDSSNGWTNEYTLEARGLKLLNLCGQEYSVLNWMAVLLRNRRVDISTEIAARAYEYIITNYDTDLSKADVVYGYRADDSYFFIARAFLNNRIPVEVLEQALHLGGLGNQVMLRSRKSFKRLNFVSAQFVDCSLWHPKRIIRDSSARKKARDLEKAAADTLEGTYIADLMRGASAWGK